MHLHILKEINEQFQNLMPILAEQRQAITLSSTNITIGYNTQVTITAVPPLTSICTDILREERPLQIDVDGKEAQIHFNDKISLTLPSEQLELSTIYVIIDQIKLLINFIERIQNGTYTD